MPTSACVHLDLRPPDQYAGGHLLEAHSFPWPISPSELCRLPPRERRVQVLVGADTREDARALFQRLGYAHVEYVDPSCLLPDTLTLAFPTSVPWSPNPFLAAHLAEIEAILHGPGVAVDVGSGTGRDMVYLARQGWFVVGFENRVKLIRDGNAFSQSHDTLGRTANLRTDVSQGLPLRPGTADLVTVCRFIHRDSFPRVLRLLRPGGLLLYSHFLEGCENTAVGHPKDTKGFFREGELERMAVAENCDILRSERGFLPDGRPMVHLIAQFAK